MQPNSGRKLWEKAKKIIPGGNQLLSKRSEMFLPDYWPSYYSKARGCELWGLDGEHYYDFAHMGVGTCVLGYADDDVNQAVIDANCNGAMSTLNCPEEVSLAERLIEIHPWSEMVRFSRCGGEACAIAVRIARAASGRNKVAFCGYHGWHDWYLAANISDGSHLDEQLLPGLDAIGVPPELSGTSLPFNYNRLDELESLVARYADEIGVIIMEPVRSTPPEPGFLEGVRDIADRIGAVLIFDEVTSGFRINFGGIHLEYGVTPDIAVFGKALGNGTPISAVIGQRNVMEAAQSSFISSTFWTERTGYAAALATLEKMDRCTVQSHLVACGERINKSWLALSEHYGVPVSTSGIAPLTHISFNHEKNLELQTLYTQELLKRGVLAGGAFYASYAHSDECLDIIEARLDEVFSILSKAITSGDVDSLLDGKVRHAGFHRLS